MVASDFERRVGRPACTVWNRLRAMRDERGRCTATVEEIAGDALRTRYVRKGLARLRAVGLVDTQPGSGRVGGRVRVIRGAAGIDVQGKCVFVPAATWRALREAQSWGGARSTRRRKQEGPKAKQARKVKEETKQEGPKAEQEGSFAEIAEARGAVCTGTETALAPLPEGEGDEAAPPEGGRTRAHAHPDPRSLCEGEAVSVSEETEGAPSGAPVGFSFGSRTRSGGWEYEGVPPMPTPDVLKPVTLPAPPLLRTDHSLGQQVEFVVATWEAAVSQRYNEGKPYHGVSYRRGGVTGGEHFDALASSCAAFIEHSVAPAAWIAWQFDQWEKAGNKRAELVAAHAGKRKPRKRRRRRTSKPQPPPVALVFDPERITEMRGWFRREADNMPLGGRVIFTQSHRELLRRHAIMRNALTRLDDPTPARVAAVVRKCFPADCYNELMERARVETKELQARLRRRAARGEWLW